MFALVFRRLLSLAVVLWIIVTATFALLCSVKGGPFDSERALAPEVERNLRARYHLDATPWQRYWSYAGSVLRFDLGPFPRNDLGKINKAQLVQRYFEFAPANIS